MLKKNAPDGGFLWTINKTNDSNDETVKGNASDR